MKLALLGCLLVTGITANAQSAIMKDINPAASSNPAWFTEYGNKLLFLADNGTNGMELYAYDTTASLVYDLNPGLAAGAISTNHRKMARIGKDVYFPGDNGNTGIELYKWAGDSTAPVLAADVNPGSTSSDIQEVLAVGNKIYFNANSGSNGNELWVYDPATGIAQRLTDLSVGSGNTSPYNLTEFKGKLYFAATGTGFGTELFVYDPADNTTKNAIDIVTGPGSSSPQAATVINNKIWFSATTAAFGRELYTFDGTVLQRLTNVDNASGDGLANVDPGQTGIISYRNMILFAGNNGTSDVQLYQYNPANNVTSMVFMLNPSSAASPSNFTLYAGKVYFSADNGSQGNELWSYDGNALSMVADIEAGINSSFPMNMYRYGTKLYFSAMTMANGRELYIMLDSAALGIKNVRFNAEVTAYPNPAKDKASIEIKLQNTQNIALTVTDITGKVVYSLEPLQYDATLHTLHIPMQNLMPGMYTYTLRSNTGALLYSGRIEKQ